MRVKSLVCSSASIGTLCLLAMPVWAQAASGTEEIVVTGYRQSIASQQGIRQHSDQIVDAIVAEDIGKLPDVAVSDSTARIPGVQVERGGGEAGRVLVRGLPDYTTTYNGREIFTAETRSVALQDFPSGLVSGIDVFKTSSSDLVEPGLAGLINVRSHRPFDFDGFAVAGSAWGLYTTQKDTITPNGNILVTDRWKTGLGEIGALVGFSYTRLHYLDSVRSNTDFVAGGGPNGSRFPDIERITYNEGDRERPSANAAVQWRPSEELEFYVEGLWQGFRNAISDRETSAALWGGSGFTNPVYVEGRPDLLKNATVINPFRPEGFQGGTFNKTNTYQVAFGGSYESGRLKLSSDIAYTDSTFTGSTESVDFAFASPQTVTFDSDVGRDGGGAQFSFANFDAANPANYIYRGFYEEAQQATGKDWQARIDASYDTGWNLLKQVQAGFRYTDREAHREFGNRYAWAEDQRLPFSAVPLDYELFTPGFSGSDVQPDYRTWLSPTYESIRNNLVKMREFVIAHGGSNYTTSTVAPDPLQTWDTGEQNYAFYGQVGYELSIADIPIDGKAGLRYVRTEVNLTGTQFQVPAGGGAGVLTPVDVARVFEDWLPSINTRIRFTDEWQARLSFSKTRTRPGFTDLRASGTLDQPPTCLDQTPRPQNCFQTGNGGNPYLNPLKSDNYDAALEYYFSRTGYVSGSVFLRDLTGFIENNVFQGLTPEGIPLRLSGPVNSGGGKISGFEAQVSTFFDFLDLPQFGIQANVTNLSAAADFNYDAGLDPSGTAIIQTVNRPLLGVSHWSYNLIGIYEVGGVSARLAYNWRSSFPLTYQRRGDHLYTEKADPVGRLDLSVSYDLMDNITLFGDWTNMLGDGFISNLTRIDTAPNNGAPTGFTATYPRLNRYEESTVSAGIRFHF
jgi:TonB-dependent receptor